MGNSASGEEGADAGPDSTKKSKKKSQPKKQSIPNEEINTKTETKTEEGRDTKDEEEHIDNLENTPPTPPIKKEKVKKEAQHNPDTGSIRSSCVSIPDLIDAVNSPDYDPDLPFVDSETGKPLFKKKGPFAKEGEENDSAEEDKMADDRPVKYTRENDLDQLSITNEECL